VEIPYKFSELADLLVQLKSSHFEQELEEKFNLIYKEISTHFEGLAEKKIRTNFNHLYYVYCLSDTGYTDASEMITDKKQQLTALLTGMYEADNFNDSYMDDVLEHHTSIYSDDCTVIHWYSGLIIDEQGNFQEKLFIIELANIQFFKLRVYDDYIDNYLNNYLRKANQAFHRFLANFLPGVRSQMKEITSIRVELEKITDIMDNFEKFYGNWYQAKIYYLASDAFAIQRWRKLIRSRMDIVNELYSLLNEEVNRSRMLFLNFLMLLLFLLWFINP